MKCQNCAVLDGELRQCKVCHSWICRNCYLEHLRWSQESSITDKMVRKALRIEQQITDGFNLLYQEEYEPIKPKKKGAQTNLDELFW